MKNRILYIGLSLITALGLNSCKNDLDVFAPGEEAVSVYGILNPNETVQNIRINKVYLTNGDALTAGQNSETINYGPGELRVSLQRFMSLGSTTPTLTSIGTGSVGAKKEIVLTETVVTTASGSFSQSQRVWQTTDRLYGTGEYKLTIKNINTGKEFTSQAVMVDSVRSSSVKPFIYHPTLYPMHGGYVVTGSPTTQQIAYIDYSVLTATQRIKFKSIANAKLYSIVMRFHYIDSLISGGTGNNYADFAFANLKSSSLVGGEDLEVSFSANDFYVVIGKEMQKKFSANVKNRRSFYIEYVIKAGAESLNTFLQVNEPSTSIAQDKPNYTNINGGVGVFSSSSRSIITHDLWNDFIDKIACHPSTNPYKFLNSSGNLSSVCP